MRISLIFCCLCLFIASACQPKPDTGVGVVKSEKAMANTIPTPSAWKIISCSSGGKTVDAVNDKGFVAIRDGQIGGNTGCNSFGGEWTGPSAKMKVGGVMATKMFCADANKQEVMVLDVFNGTVSAKLAGDELTLTGNGITLQLERDDSRLN
ncbi:META domain-containing protein [Neolewinella aurantiaca]|uniref:META domain-containing protein n=1 Tax=Neolewinella aurantiaca TaxID=2602767 RepID=A0A5C7FZ24_9BACT|nr:META domain-containing protein [Neolewinella aurantiaca]TXF90987.1 META domain-containing protein [Neolewinella aurantiaca]